MREAVVSMLRIFFKSPLFRAPEDPSHTVLLYAALDFVEKQAKARKEELREGLLKRAEEHGKKTDNGFALVEGDARAVRSDKRSNLPPEKELRRILKEAEIPFEDVYERQVEWVINPSKIERLIDIGKLKAEEIEKHKTVTLALRVTPEKPLKFAFDHALFSEEDNDH